MLAPGATVELDRLLFQVLPPQASDDPASKHELWEGATTYPELGAALLLAKEPPPRKITLQFTAPVTFKSGGKHLPIPLPGLVFGSLLERWNAFAPITFPPEVKRYAEECLAVGYYKLSSRPVPVKRGGMRVGGVGEISYTTVNYDRYWMSVIGTLARFALYSGVGAGTTMGLGQCRAVEG
jgi:CRISPR-associated endoribonuclease Cas6